MNIQPYRASFTVIVVDSHVDRGAKVADALSSNGYTVEHRLQMESLFLEIKKNPPHVILFSYQDRIFFDTFESQLKFIEKVRSVLPETHMIVLHDSTAAAEVVRLYESGIYDTVLWPSTTAIELIQAVDRAVECDYYNYLNEQLKADGSGVSGASGADFALFEIWLKELDHCISLEAAVDHWLKEAQRFFKTDSALFLRYIESKQTLVAQRGVGAINKSTMGLGIDLVRDEPGFQEAMLYQPEQMISLHDFVTEALGRTESAYYTLVNNNRPLGVVLVPAREGQVYSKVDLDSGYMESCGIQLTRHLLTLELQEKIKKFSSHDPESEAFHFEFFQRKLKEEVSRARRILRPTSLIMISIETFEDLALTYPREQMNLFVKGFAEVLLFNSRLNDLVGRIERDRFVVCLPHTPYRGALVKAERFRRLLESADFSAIFGTQVQISVRMGVGEYPRFAHDAEGLFQSTENALYEAKKSSKVKIVLGKVNDQFVPDFVVQNE